MSQPKFISRFSPNRTAYEDLEKIHVQREGLLANAVELLKESALTENKHHLLFVGPRGCGKTHLLSLIFHRLQNIAELGEHLRIAWLNEDETSTSFLDLLVRIYRALSLRYPVEFPSKDLETLYGSDPEEARHQLEKRIVERAGKHTVLVMVENLDALFGQLEETQQKTWRAFIQNHPVFATAATAQGLFAGVSDRDCPFFGFFDTQHLKPLTVEEASELLQRIARLNENTELAEFLATPRGRARVHAIHHLSGGNHRLYIVLSDFITAEALDELVRPFEEMVDEQLTPYYQERLRWVSPQQRKIVEFLCFQNRPVPVKEIAERLFATHSTITSQLKTLRELGYVVCNVRGRESLYELAEPLMRLCMQVKETQERQPLGLIVDFLRVWYEREQLETYLDGAAADAPCRAYLTAALAKLKSGEPNLRHELLRRGLVGIDLSHCDDEQFEILRLLAEDDGQPGDLIKYALACTNRDLYRETIDVSGRIIGTPSASAATVTTALFVRACALGLTGKTEDAMSDLDRLIALPDTPVVAIAMALNCRGSIFQTTGRTADAIATYSQVIGMPEALTDLTTIALVQRGECFSETGRFDDAIADFTKVIDLAESPVESLLRALIQRGNCFGQTGYFDSAITDFSRVIDLPTTPTEQLINALVFRSIIFGEMQRTHEALDDCARVIELPGAAPHAVAFALLTRGDISRRLGRSTEAIADFELTTRIADAPPELVIEAKRHMVSVFLNDNQWGESMQRLAEALVDSSLSPDSLSKLSDSVVSALLRQGLSRTVLQPRIRKVVKIYAKKEVLPNLGDSLVRNLSSLKESLLSAEGMDHWLACWEKEASEFLTLQLPVRLLATGIAYLKDKDEGTLLELPKEERALVRQALGLPPE